ncbi:MAG: hypothetical protein JNM63_13405, partial [Spirochaetia bacterium]|nr:hypothetical protein [Spirochaetia bacterium]
TLFFGFTPDADPKAIQNADNLSGFTANYSKKNGALEISLSAKEAQGENAKIRGDAKGNLVHYAYPPPKVSVNGDKVSFTLVLQLSDKEINARVSELDYSQKFPHALTKSFWQKGARLLIQQMNVGSGRAQLTVQKVEIAYPGLSEKHFTAVDLRPFANMGFKDETEGDGKGGWTDQGKNDLSYLKTGFQKIEGLPFDIIDPGQNKGKSCVMLYSTHKESFPREVGPVPVGARAHSLLFLHSAAWTRTGIVAGHYDVVYSDKSRESVKVVVGRHLDDWWSLKNVEDDRAALILKVKSDESGKGSVGVYAYQWVNPHPEKTLDSLHLVSEASDPILGLLAVTRVSTGVNEMEEGILKAAFTKTGEVDLRKDPPDKNIYPDQIFVKSKKTVSDQAFSVAGYYTSAASSFAEDPEKWANLVKTAGGIVRYPYGLEISFNFWPYEVKDWAVVLTNKGGKYGTIQPWF